MIFETFETFETFENIDVLLYHESEAMKFRLPRKIKYLRKARHWHGHGIHSPFLFYLVSKVIESKRQYPAYRILRFQKKHILNTVKELNNPSEIIYKDIPVQTLTGKKKLFKNVELGYRYGKLLLRLVNEFKPAAICCYGPTFGMNLLYLALANEKSSLNILFSDVLLPDLIKVEIEKFHISNIKLLTEQDLLSCSHEFVFINLPFLPEETKKIILLKLNVSGEDDVIIIRGIHKSLAMEALWGDLIKERKVRVSLDLYEIGILLFRKKLQKQHFVLRF